MYIRIFTFIVIFQLIFTALSLPVPQNINDWITPEEATKYGVSLTSKREVALSGSKPNAIQLPPGSIISKPAPPGDFVFPTEKVPDDVDDDKITKIGIGSILGKK